MNCPVCKHTGITEGTARCPKCNSDLEAFQAIERLDKSRSKQKTSLIACLSLLVVLIVALVVFIVMMSRNARVIKDENIQLTGQVNQQTQLNEQLVKNNGELQASVDDLNKKLEEASKPKIVEHIVKKGETLSDISKKYYGKGQRYHKISCDNNLDDPGFIRTGQKLIIYL